FDQPDPPGAVRQIDRRALLAAEGARLRGQPVAPVQVEVELQPNADGRIAGKGGTARLHLLVEDVPARVMDEGRDHAVETAGEQDAPAVVYAVSVGVRGELRRDLHEGVPIPSLAHLLGRGYARLL